MQKLITFIIIFFSFQMNAIDIQLTATNETCPFNGVITVEVSNQTVGTPITYELFLLPNTTTPVQTQQTNVFFALVAGNYRVKVTQVVGGNSSTATEDVTITGSYIPISFTISEVKVKCGMDGSLTINVTSGIPVSYQITAGPVTTGVQTDNVFNNLPVGQYNIKVVDNCGQAFVQTFTLVNIIPSVLINEGGPYQFELPECGIASIKHGIGFDPNIGISSIFYPLSIEVTAFPNSGVPIVSSQIIISGLELIFQVPMDANGLTLPYNVKITDACGNIFTRNNNIVDVKFDFEIPIVQDNCANYYVKFLPENYKSPYVITFINAPSGFNPLNYNTNHPGPFNGVEVQYGDIGNYLPEGTYEVQITDNCGNTKIKTFSIGASFEPVSIPVILDCINGSISISISPPIDLSNVTIVSAPVAYTGVLPQDVSSFINAEGIFVITGIPVGTYVFDLTDACGNFYNDYIVDIPFFPENPIVLQRVGCDLGDGSVKIYFVNSDIMSVEVIEAPSSFGFILPYDVSFNISTEKDFYMNSFPEGLYKFKVKNICGEETQLTVNVTGYVNTATTVNITPNCGSFNLELNHVSNANFITSYFLQKYNPVDDVWEHPETGVDYIDGQDVNDGLTLGGASAAINNAIRIFNNENNLNLVYGDGLFRVVKRFLNYSNGISTFNKCISSLYEFNFQSGPQLIDVYAFPCANSTQEVVVVATGLGPLLYRIVEKNGQPFLINNNTSNSFSGLETAIYKFEIEDNCGNVLVTFVDVSLLNPPVITESNLCNGSIGRLEVQILSFVTYRWFKTTNPTVTLSTANFLEFNPFNILNDAGMYGVEITTTSSNSCVNQTLFYTIVSNGFNPNAGNDLGVTFCAENLSIDLNDLLTNPHDSNGVWTDALTGLVLPSTNLNLSLLNDGITDYIYTVSGSCSLSDSATISINILPFPPPTTTIIASNLCDGLIGRLEVDEIPFVTYRWYNTANPTVTLSTTYFLEFNTFSSVLNTGTYEVEMLTPATNSCINQVLQYFIDPVPYNPNAGNDSVNLFCEETLSVDLNSLLTNPHDNNGVWTNANGIVLASTIIDPIVLGVGTTDFIYTVTGICSTSDSATISIEVNPFPIAPTITMNPSVLCIGGDLQLETPLVTDATYFWTGPDGFTSSLQNPLITNFQAQNNGDYFLFVTVKGCNSPTTQSTVLANFVPDFTISGATEICQTQSAILSVLPNNFTISDANITYQWYFNDGIIASGINETFEAFDFGTYKVEVNNQGCISEQEITITEKLESFPVILAQGCLGNDYMITIENAATFPNAVYSWTGPNGFVSNDQNINVSSSGVGLYSVLVTDALGCTATAQATVERAACFIPNGLSPNGDGDNDFLDLAGYFVKKLTILNRWGRIVYEKDNYINEWKGQSNEGNLLPATTYYYIIDYETEGENKKMGWIYITY
jgi:gliding motility-associated-like protein